MKKESSELWNAWRDNSEIKDAAESWMTKDFTDHTPEDELLDDLLYSNPSKMLSILLAVAQLSEDEKTIGNLAAGHFENFLGVNGESFIDTIQDIALQESKLRAVLRGVWQGSMPKEIWRRVEILKPSSFS